MQHAACMSDLAAALRLAEGHHYNSAVCLSCGPRKFSHSVRVCMRAMD